MKQKENQKPYPVKRMLRQLIAVLLSAAMVISVFAVPMKTEAAVQKKEDFLLRRDVAKEAAALLGATIGSEKMNTIKDMQSGSTYYKEMSAALHAGIVTPRKDKTLCPTAKATNKYIAALFSKVTGIAEKELLGNRDPRAGMSKKEFQEWKKEIAPNIIKKSGEKVAEGNVFISQPGITLKNVTVTGNLIIGDGVGDKEVILENVIVKGETYVRGGGENSVIIRGDSELPSIIIKQVNNRVSLKVQGNSKVDSILVRNGSDDVIVSGKVGVLKLEASDTNVIAKAAQIEKTVITGTKATIQTTEQTRIDQVIIEKTAAGSKIKSEAGTQVRDITINAENVVVSGSGQVDSVSVKADNSTISVPGAQVKVDENVKGTDTTTPDNGTNTPSGSGGSSSGGSGGGNSGGSGEDPLPAYERDSRFAEGYPQITYTEETEELQIRVKLAEGVASESKPAGIYMVSMQDDFGYETTTEAVLHGHNGIVNAQKHELGSNAGDGKYITIKDNEEHSFKNVYVASDYYLDKIIYLVIETEDKTSRVPTKITYKTGAEEPEAGTPQHFIRKAFLNQARDKITLYFYGSTDSNSVPEPSCFTAGTRTATGAAIDIKIINNYDKKINGIYPDCRVEVTMEHPIALPSIGDPITIAYRQPEQNPIQNTSNPPAKLESFAGKVVEIANLNSYTCHVSENGKYAKVELSASIRDTLKDATITINGKTCKIQSQRSYYSRNEPKTIFMLECPEGIKEDSYSLMIVPKGGEGLIDMAMDKLPIPFVIDNANIAKKSEVQSATYSKGEKTLDVSFTGTLEGTVACLFTTHVGGKSYTLRNFAYSREGSLSFVQDTLEHIDFSETESFTLTYKKDPRLEYSSYYMSTITGELIDEFTITVTIVD